MKAVHTFIDDMVGDKIIDTQAIIPKVGTAYAIRAQKESTQKGMVKVLDASHLSSSEGTNKGTNQGILYLLDIDNNIYKKANPTFFTGTDVRYGTNVRYGTDVFFHDNLHVSEKTPCKCIALQSHG